MGERVCGPAGLRDTAFLRSDELPGRAAPAAWRLTACAATCSTCRSAAARRRLYSTVGDVHAFWRALFAGRIVPLPLVEEMMRPRSDVPEESRRYGLGFWLHESRDIALLTGYDAGVSFRTGHDPADVTWTVISNTSEGARPVATHLEEVLLG